MGIDIKEVVKAKKPLLVTEKEQNLIEIIRKANYGTIEKVMIKEGQPVRIEKVREGIDL